MSENDAYLCLLQSGLVLSCGEHRWYQTTAGASQRINRQPCISEASAAGRSSQYLPGGVAIRHPQMQFAREFHQGNRRVARGTRLRRIVPRAPLLAVRTRSQL